MADEKETQAQFDLQVQINKVLQDRQGLLKAQEKALSNQVQLAVDLCKALKCEQLDDIEKRLGGVQEELKKAAEEASRMGDDLETAAERGVTGSSRLSGALKTASENVNATSGAVIGLGAGIVSAFSAGFQTLMNFGSGIVGVLSSFGRLGKAIFALPFRLLEGLFSIAQSTGGGVSPIRLELENIRKEFGSLATNEGKAGASSLDQFRASASNLAGTGLTLRRVFGMGREGVAKAMAYNTELMKALGPAVGNFNAVIQKSAVELAMYRKGLGLTAEQQAQMLKLAQASGKDPVDAMRELASGAINMGEQFGINAKLISSDVGQMKQDFANFGTLSTRELLQTSVFARKLGIDIKSLTGLVSAFDNFEDAAQNAAKLSQSMGMNIDAMKLMNAQNPAERLSLLQKAFKETGKSVDAMSRQELKLLAAQSGLDEETAKMAFSQRGLSMSYDQVQKAGAKAEKKQLTQAEAMSKLADSIERVFGSGGGTQFKSFFDAFSEGFARGIIKSKEFMAVSRAIRRSLKAVYWGGVEIGRMFVALFPGIKEMMGGLKSLFDPARFRVLMSGLKDVFRIFFTDIQTDPKAGVKNFIKNFKTVFKDFFSSGGDGVNSILEGGKSFLNAMKGIFNALLPIAVNGLAELINKISDIIKNPPEVPAAVSEMFDNLFDAFKGLLITLWQKLAPPLGNMFVSLFEKASPYLQKAGTFLLTATLTRVILTSALKAAAGAIAGGAAKIVSSAIVKIFGIATSAVPEPAAPGGDPGAAASRGPSLVKFLGMAAVVILAFAAVALIYKGLDLNPIDALGIGIIMVAISASAVAMSAALKLLPKEVDYQAMAVLTTMMIAMGGAAVIILALLSKVPWKSLVVAPAFIAVMTAMTMSAIPLVMAAFIISQMKNNMKEAVIGMALLGVLMMEIGLVGVAISGLLSLIPNPTGVGALMSAITSIMYATVLMLPAALALGLMLSSVPFGPIGLAAIAAGFAVLGGLASIIVGSLVPSIVELSKIRLTSPTSFKAVTGALVDIMRAINGFVLALAGLSFFLRPSGSNNTETFEGNIKSFSRLINVLLSSGIGRIISTIINFAKSSNVKEGTAQAIAGIGSILSSIASLMSSMSPSSDAYTAVATAAATWGEDAQEMLETVNKGMKNAAIGLRRLLPTIGTLITDIFSSIKEMPPEISNVAPVISAIGSVLSSVASLMKAFSPSDAAWKAVSDAAGSINEDADAMSGSLIRNMQWLVDQLPRIIDSMSTGITKMISSIGDPIKEIINSAGSVNPDTLKSVSSIMTSVMGAIGTLMNVMIPMFTEAGKIAAKAKTGATVSFTTVIDSMMSAISGLGPALETLKTPLTTLISAIIDISQGIKYPQGLKSRIDVISSALSAVSALSSVFGPGGPLSNRNAQGGTFERRDMIINAMNETVTNILGPSGPLKGIIDALNSFVIKNPYGLKQKAETLKVVFESVTSIGNAFQALNSTAFKNIGTAASKIEQLFDNMSIFSRMNEIVSSIPSRVSDRTQQITSLATQFSELSRVLSSSQLGDIDSVVELTQALQGNQTLTVRHENVQINLNIIVQMSAEQIARGILNVNNTTNLPTERFSTTTSTT